MHTITIFQGTKAILRVTRPHFKHAWRLALKTIRALARATGQAGVELETPKRRATVSIGHYRMVPDRYVR